MTPRTDPDPAYPPIERASLPDTVADRLAGRILDGELASGDRLPGERALAERLGVSRIVVREALGRLQARGLVEVRPGVGAFVAAMPERVVTEPLSLYIRRHGVGLDQLFDVRRALEPQIAASAARRRSDAQLAALRSTQRRTVTAAEALASAVEDHTGRDDADGEEALESFAWSDLTFHQQLAEASGNPLFEVLLVPLVEPLLGVRREGARRPGAAPAAAAQHAAILAAVEAGDAAAAADAMLTHLDTVAAWLRPAPEPTRSDQEVRP